MIKFILGAVFVVALVGYGIITPDTLEDAGSRVKHGINSGAAWIKDKTDPDVNEKISSFINNQ